MRQHQHLYSPEHLCGSEVREPSAPSRLSADPSVHTVRARRRKKKGNDIYQGTREHHRHSTINAQDSCIYARKVIIYITPLHSLFLHLVHPTSSLSSHSFLHRHLNTQVASRHITLRIFFTSFDLIHSLLTHPFSLFVDLVKPPAAHPCYCVSVILPAIPKKQHSSLLI